MTFPWASCRGMLWRNGIRLSVVRSFACAGNDRSTNARIAARRGNKMQRGVPSRAWDVAPGEKLVFRDTGVQKLGSGRGVVDLKEEFRIQKTEGMRTEKRQGNTRAMDDEFQLARRRRRWNFDRMNRIGRMGK